MPSIEHNPVRFTSLGESYWVHYGKALTSQGGQIPVVGSSGVYARTPTPLITHATVVVGRKGSAGVSWLVTEPSHPSDTTFYIVPKADCSLDLEFLYFALRANPPKDEQDVIPSLKKPDLEAFPVPSFPPTEQKNIARVLSLIRAAVENQERIVATLAELKAATLDNLFRQGIQNETLRPSEIGPIPESWQTSTIAKIKAEMNYGTSKHCVLDRIGDPVLRIPNVIGGGINTEELKYAKLDHVEKAKTLLEPGDLLFVRTNGNKNYTGRCAVYKGMPEGALFASYLIRVRLRPKIVLPDLVAAYLSSVGKEQIKVNPTADGKFNIDTGILNSLVVPLPTPEEQEEMLIAIASMDSSIEVAKQKLTTLGELFESTLHALMTAKVRVNNLQLPEEVVHA